MSDFTSFIASGAPALAEGAVVERLRRDPRFTLDPDILNGGLIYDAAGRARLADIHRDYFAAAATQNLPLLAFADSWRCSADRIAKSRFADKTPNQDNVAFLRELRKSVAGAQKIFIGGLVGPAGDAYRPAEALSRRAARIHHQKQIDALAEAGADFLMLATAPAVEEALGVAEAMSATDRPYLISFVIRRSGHVLDGVELGAAIEKIDAESPRPPLGFAVNCVHAHVLEQALAAMQANHAAATKRLLLFQANTADREVEELDEAAELIGEAPEVFAQNLARLRKNHRLRILGGCCGTDAAHLAALARRCD